MRARGRIRRMSVVEGTCPDCGSYASGEAGQPTPMHQAPGGRSTCSGVGKPLN